MTFSEPVGQSTSPVNPREWRLLGPPVFTSTSLLNRMLVALRIESQFSNQVCLSLSVLRHVTRRLKAILEWNHEGVDVWTSPWAANMCPAPHTKNHPTGYSWLAQQLRSGSPTASGLASTVLKLIQQCSTNSRPPGHWVLQEGSKLAS